MMRFLASLILLALLALTILLALNIRMGKDVGENIARARQIYGGGAEEALLSFLEDDQQTAQARSHVAIWTLGRIRSDKALPVLRSLYKDDPRGISCQDKHEDHLCQRELYKAIRCIEKGWYFSHARYK